MRRIVLLLAVIPGLLAIPAAAADNPPPAGDISNIDYISTVTGTTGITSMNVLRYGNRDVLVAVGRFGLKTFDLADPEAPVELDHLESDAMRLPEDRPTGTFWQSESTNVDPTRKLVFLSRDPRAYSGSQSTSPAGVYIIDARDPADLRLNLFHEIPAGHTTTCINDCQYLWSGGPAPRADQPSDWIGRPIFVTDVRNPRKPVTSPTPIDLGRRDGRTDYSHDVQVDNQGIAWVSGRGGVRGYHTSGRHHDPVLGRPRVATALDPIPYAGGGLDKVGGISMNGAAHNSERPVDGLPGKRNGIGDLDAERGHIPDADDGADYAAHGFEAGELLYTTHERFESRCADTGRFYISSLRGSHNGEGWKSTPEDPFRLETLSSWSPYEQEGSNPDTSSCSAHYFRIKDGLVVGSWYGQGTRVLDVRDPYNPRQVAYYRPDGTSSYTPLLYGDYIFIADNGRSRIDIVKLSAEGEALRSSGGEVVAPQLSDLAIKAMSTGFAADPGIGWACRIPA